MLLGVVLVHLGLRGGALGMSCDSCLQGDWEWAWTSGGVPLRVALRALGLGCEHAY